MSYYLLQREGGTLYAMNLLLSEDEASRYGHEGEMVPVTALVAWSDAEKLEGFRQFLSAEQENPHSPFAELVRDMQDDRVHVVEHNSVGMRGQLRRARGPIEFALVNPGPEQEVMKVEELLGPMGVDPADRQEIVESDENPKITGPPINEFKAEALNQAVGKTIAAVEYGAVEGYPGWVHEGEAIVLHFTDGTALSIEIGSNVRNLVARHPDLEPEDFHTDLIPMWRDRDRP
jgi:hypothetical protein